MKVRFSLCLAAISVVMASATALFAQDTVAVYLEPSTSGTIYYNETLEDLNKRNPEPYPPGQAETEWMTIPYPGTYVGYVEPSFVGEDMTVSEGAPIYLRARKDSQVLDIVNEDFSPQVIELGPNWATVYYEGTAPAFFKWPASQPVVQEVEMVTATSAPTDGGEIVAVTEAEAVLAPAAAPSGEIVGGSSMAVASTPATATPATALENPAAPVVAPTPAPAPVVASSTPELAPMAATPQSSIPISESAPPPFTSKQITRTWEGKLVRIKGFDKLFGPDYKYALEDAKGDRIAYVDLSKALLFEPIENYWDRNVIIDGTAERITSRPPVAVTVRVIRPRF